MHSHSLPHMVATCFSYKETTVMALQQCMGCELDFDSHLEQCLRADSILQFPNSALVYMALKQATYVLSESTASKNIPHSCGPGKWQIGKWVTEHYVLLLLIVCTFKRGEESVICAIFILSIILKHMLVI